MLTIVRDGAGNFMEFGDPAPLLIGDLMERFAGLMPRNKRKAREAASAKATLLALGMRIVNGVFDPTMN